MTQPPSTSKQILTSILLPMSQISLPTTPQPQTPSTQHNAQPPHSILQSLPPPYNETTKSILLTLHFLFPHELLPALDLIDRHLLTHLTLTTPTSTSTSTSTPTPDAEMYLVQSASNSTATKKTGRFRNALDKKGLVYEVQLDAWNCSCPAFAYSCLKLMGREREQPREPEWKKEMREDGRSKWEWLVGGTATKDGAMVPICKHILAVVLVKAAPGVFGSGVTSREVSREEMAGWAAGWGEH